jgi:integrase
LATWDEIDIDRAVWTIPKERMKAGKEHRVPLAYRPLAILISLPRRGDYVFQRKGRPLSNMAMLKTLALAGYPDPTVHGFRSSFRTWAAEMTDVARDIAEAALAHSVGSDVERAYQRGELFDKRRNLMNLWAEFCTSRFVKTGFPGLPRESEGL